MGGLVVVSGGGIWEVEQVGSRVCGMAWYGMALKTVRVLVFWGF